MELHFSSPSSSLLFSRPNNTIVIEFPSVSKSFGNLHSKRRCRHIRLLKISSSSAAEMMTLDQPGGKMVVELVGAFNELTGRMSHSTVLSSSSTRLLFKALKLSIPILHSLPLLPDGRSPLSKALSLAVILADLQMDAEVISAGMLREVIEGGGISMYEVRDRIGAGTAHLLHESMRLKDISAKVEALDDDSASALRKFCLIYYDVRAIILDLVLKLDMMRHLDYLPRYKQQLISLEVMKIYAPLAHAVGTNHLSLELEDLSFQHLFPYSYLYVDTWLRSHETGSKPLIEIYKEHLLQSLRSDQYLTGMVQDISVEGRYKSRYSTMKKLLRDGRKPEEVHDILGLRVILSPAPAVDSSGVGEKACYRAREIIQSLWKEMPSRSKDYIMHPKANGYKSLHMAVDISDSVRTRPLMEIQIRTAEMDMFAAGGTASHALYKGGLTDPEEAKRLKAIMMAAAELAALRLEDFPSKNHKGLEIDHRDRVFRLLDKNGDGKISIDELMEVMEELGAQGEDAREMMQLLDSNSDGSLSSDEFDLFQKQVEFTRSLDDKDVQYKTLLNEKLQMEDSSRTVHVYGEELETRLLVN
ncbi:putative guanosine polyphosphate pyrophosphohydrolase/synthase [Handroanthus impetiginosus]|uniref:GTP diphosphokinase n=1 Tax=Handroanthus impetiginosus TaxID=429701 RepID=A0A2G9G4T8_9LAMI|nr:putative guanosine polyphosphate pyrophosphohydrolase/synthase [Handroanthus impetiginosus]PIN23279.1 putative guanosine polyphosphate pyrophosphohydrolase/synthase [Handroanthus impetiginosus]